MELWPHWLENVFVRKNAKVKRVVQGRIRKYRKQIGFTQEDLADKVKVSRAYVGYIEQGRNTPSLELLDRIARALRVSLSELVK